MKSHYSGMIGCLLLMLFCHGEVSAKTVQIVSDEWPGYTHADGSGVYWQIVKLAFEQQGIEVRSRVSNWKRARHLMLSQRADVLLGEHKYEHSRFIFPKWHLDYDGPLYLFSRQPLDDLSVLQNQLVGSVLGFEYHRLLPVGVRPYDVASVQDALALLERGRLGAFIGPANAVPESSPEYYRRKLKDAQPIYLVFHNDFSGRQLAQAFDQGMEHLYRTGRLQTIFANPERFRQAHYESLIEFDLH